MGDFDSRFILQELYLRQLKVRGESMAFKDAFKTFPIIETKRLILRPMNKDDAPTYLKWFSTKEVREFLGGLTCPKNIEESLRFIDNMNGVYFTKKRTICWGIALKESNELIGRFEICRFIRQSMAEVAYSLAKEHWNNGYMTEVLRAVVKFGFEIMELHRIEATAATENEASAKVLHKAGFITEGILRKYNCGDEFRDTYIMSILNEDYFSNVVNSQDV